MRTILKLIIGLMFIFGPASVLYFLFAVCWGFNPISWDEGKKVIWIFIEVVVLVIMFVLVAQAIQEMEKSRKI